MSQVIDSAGEPDTGCNPDYSPMAVGGPFVVCFPDDWAYTTSWRRAVHGDSEVGRVTPYTFHVLVGHPQEPDVSDRRVEFVIDGGELAADCPCKGFEHRRFCAHVATLYWYWTRRRIGVTERDTGRVYHGPPPWFDPMRGRPLPRILPDVSDLTPAEYEAYEAVERQDFGVREFARETDRRPGTVGNLLRRAREKVGGDASC